MVQETVSRKRLSPLRKASRIPDGLTSRGSMQANADIGGVMQYMKKGFTRPGSRGKIQTANPLSFRSKIDKPNRLKINLIHVDQDRVEDHQDIGVQQSECTAIAWRSQMSEYQESPEMR